MSSEIRKEYEQVLEKYQGLKEELERMWKLKAEVAPVMVGPLKIVIPKLGEKVVLYFLRN